MVTVVRWTGREARALRDAVRMSVRDFATHTNLSVATIADMEAKGERAKLRNSTQKILDGILATAPQEVQQRFGGDPELAAALLTEAVDRNGRTRSQERRTRILQVRAALEPFGDTVDLSEIDEQLRAQLSTSPAAQGTNYLRV